MNAISFQKHLVRIIGAVSMVLFIAACSSTSSTGSGEASTSGMDGSSADGSFGSGVNTGGDISSDDLSGGDMNTAGDRVSDAALAAVGSVVYFDFDESTIRPDSRDILLVHAAYLKQTGKKVTLEGHADERGTREYNMALGERRAKAVRDFLVIQGVDRAQLGVVSFGEEQPAAYGSNPTSWAKNRRVEIR